MTSSTTHNVCGLNLILVKYSWKKMILMLVWMQLSILYFGNIKPEVSIPMRLIVSFITLCNWTIHVRSVSMK